MRPANSDGPPPVTARRHGSPDWVSTAHLPSCYRPPHGGFFETTTEIRPKKTGLNISSTGITSVPGLFSELFNVAASRPAQMTTEWLQASPQRAFRQGELLVNRGRERPHGEEAPLRRLEP